MASAGFSRIRAALAAAPSAFMALAGSPPGKSVGFRTIRPPHLRPEARAARDFALLGKLVPVSAPMRDSRSSGQPFAIRLLSASPRRQSLAIGSGSRREAWSGRFAAPADAHAGRTETPRGAMRRVKAGPDPARPRGGRASMPALAKKAGRRVFFRLLFSLALLLSGPSISIEETRAISFEALFPAQSQKLEKRAAPTPAAVAKPEGPQAPAQAS
jgi:hypothetical protein